MPIVYSVVSRGETVLCNAQRGNGNFTEVARSMLPNIATRNNTKTTYTSDTFLFHIVVDNGLIFMCAADPDDGKVQPYSFLQQIQSDFEKAGLVSRAHFAQEGELNGDFSGTMQQKMENFNQRMHSGNDNLSQLQSQVNEVRDVMTQNIEKVLQRGENLEDLMDKTTDLEQHSMAFKKTARQVHRKMWWKNTKMMCILGVVVLTVLLVIILIILFSTGVLPVDNSGGGSATTTTTTTAAAPAAGGGDST